MAGREWSLRFKCGHEGCSEVSNYRYPTRRDMVESFELKNFSDGRWRCIRHSQPDEVLSLANPTTRVELVVEQRDSGLYFGGRGFISGPGFKVFAADFEPGTKLIISAEIARATPKDSADA